MPILKNCHFGLKQEMNLDYKKQKTTVKNSIKLLITPLF